MSKTLTLAIFLFALSATAISQEAPDARVIFEKMKEAMGKIKTLSYQSEFVSYNSSIDDSINYLFLEVLL